MFKCSVFYSAAIRPKIFPATLNKRSTGTEDAGTLRTRFAITASVGYVIINALVMCFKLKMCLSKSASTIKEHIKCFKHQSRT